MNLLQRFVSDRSKIRARRVSGNDSQQQRDVATAIKNAREMALLPYAKRVTHPAQAVGRGERGDRGDRGDAARPWPRAEGVAQALAAEAPWRPSRSIEVAEVDEVVEVVEAEEEA